MENLTTHEQRGEKMAAPQISEFTGRALADSLTEVLNIRFTMLAAILNVTEKTLRNWQGIKYDAADAPAKFKRLAKLFDFVNAAKEAEIPDNQIYNLLHEPVSEGEDSNTILYYIVDEPGSKLLHEVEKAAIKNFLEG